MRARSSVSVSLVKGESILPLALSQAETRVSALVQVFVKVFAL